MLALTFEQHRAIDRCKEQLVTAAETLVESATDIRIGRDFGHSQLRNLIAVATETESPAVVLNFIRYQMGRDNYGNNWARTIGGDTLGERFIYQLDLEGGAVAGALAQVMQRAPGNADNSEMRQLIRIVLIRLFLGFASRYLKYLEFTARQAAGARR